MQVLPIPAVNVAVLQHTVGLPPPVADANLNRVLPNIAAYNAGHHIEDLGKAAKRRKLVDNHECPTAELGEQVLFEHRLAGTILGDAVAPPWFAPALAPITAQLTNMQAQLTNMQAQLTNMQARHYNRKTTTADDGPLLPLVSVKAPNVGNAPPANIFPATHQNLRSLSVADFNGLIDFYNEPQLNALRPVTVSTRGTKLFEFIQFIS